MKKSRILTATVILGLSSACTPDGSGSSYQPNTSNGEPIENYDKVTPPNTAQKSEIADTLNTFTVPKEFKVKADYINMAGTDFNVGDFGRIKERVLHLTTTFELLDKNGNLIAKANEIMFNRGTKIEVSDANGNIIGYLDEKVFESIFKVHTSYEIKDANETVIGTSDKSQRATTTMTFRADGKTIATFTRGMFNPFGDNWSCKILEEGKIDPRLIVFVPAFKTVKDKKRESDSDDGDNKKSKKSK